MDNSLSTRRKSQQAFHLGEMRPEKAGGAEQTLPGYCRHSSAEFSPGSAKPRSVLGTGSWLLCTALPEPGTAGGSELGPADVTNTYACHEQKGQEKSWRGSDLFSLSGVGRWGWGEGAGRHLSGLLLLQSCLCRHAIAWLLLLPKRKIKSAL